MIGNDNDPFTRLDSQAIVDGLSHTLFDCPHSAILLGLHVRACVAASNPKGLGMVLMNLIRSLSA